MRSGQSSSGLPSHVGGALQAARAGENEQVRLDDADVPLLAPSLLHVWAALAVAAAVQPEVPNRSTHW